MGLGSQGSQYKNNGILNVKKLFKRSLTKAPVLPYAEPAIPSELHVDVSREGLGGVLYKEQHGGLRPIAYVS